MDIDEELVVAHARRERARLKVVELSEQIQKAFAELADAEVRLNEAKALAAAGAGGMGRMAA